MGTATTLLMQENSQRDNPPHVEYRLGQTGNRTPIQISLWIGNKVKEEGGSVISRTNKPEAAILVQMRSGKIGLGAYLKKIKAADSAVCQCQRSNETVSHILGDASNLEHKDGRTLANQLFGMCQPCSVIQN
jgi:hypothetical protein